MWIVNDDNHTVRFIADFSFLKFRPIDPVSVTDAVSSVFTG
jgi:hypothetical protein